MKKNTLMLVIFGHVLVKVIYIFNHMMQLNII